MTEHVFDVSKDVGVMNETAELTTPVETAIPTGFATSQPMSATSPTAAPGPVESASESSETAGSGSISGPAVSAPANEPAVQENSEATSQDAAATSVPTSSVAQPSTSAADPNAASAPAAYSNAISAHQAEVAEATDGAKKTRAPRVPKAPAKPVEAGGSIATIVERVVRLTTLSEEHSAALGRLFNVSLPEDYVPRLTRLTGASLGPIGSSASEALAIVLGLESANPIHVGVQLGRLAPTALPDVFRCAHALTGETAIALPKGDNAVFAVADVLATLTTDDFALAKALSSALE